MAWLATSGTQEGRIAHHHTDATVLCKQSGKAERPTPPCHVERSRDISICRALPCLRRSLHALTLGRDDKEGKGRLVEMTTGVKPLTIIGSLDDMITFSDPVIRPRDYRKENVKNKHKSLFIY